MYLYTVNEAEAALSGMAATVPVRPVVVAGDGDCWSDVDVQISLQSMCLSFPSGAGHLLDFILIQGNKIMPRFRLHLTSLPLSHFTRSG